MLAKLMDVVLGLAFVSFVIRQQVARKSVTPRRLVVLPAAFVVLALVSDHGLAHRLAAPVPLAFLAGGLVLAVAMGLARAATMRVWQTPTGPMSKGDWRTVLLWLGTIGVRVAVMLVAARLGAVESAGEVMLFVAATVATQNVVLARRAGLLDALGVPGRRREAGVTAAVAVTEPSR
jgi:hypothetical protein